MFFDFSAREKYIAPSGFRFFELTAIKALSLTRFCLYIAGLY